MGDAVEAVVAAVGATTKRFGCRSLNLDVWLKMVRFYHSEKFTPSLSQSRKPKLSNTSWAQL